MLDEILAYTMCPNVLSHGTQDGARSAIRSTEMSGNVIELHSYMYLVSRVWIIFSHL